MATRKRTDQPELFQGPGPHGHSDPLYTGYYKRGCRCDECIKARRAYFQEYITARKKREPNYIRDVTRKLRASERGKAGAKRRAFRNSQCPKFRLKGVRKSRKRMIARRDMLAEIKLSHGCADCGYNANACALDFDHVDGAKFMGVSQMGTFSEERIRAEIAKCEVVCLNCHRQRTKRRHHNGEAAYATKRGASASVSQKRTQKCRDRGRAFLATKKLESGCVDCGYKDAPESLDFDHVRGEKLFSLATKPGASLARLSAEIAKCEVVCANCHRIRTFNRHRS